MGLKTIYSNMKFFIFQLICILAKMVITFEPVGIFSCGFRCCIQENIVGLETIYSNMKFFIFQLICILAKMVITFELVGIFSCGFRCCTQENKSLHLNHVYGSTLGIL